MSPHSLLAIAFSLTPRLRIRRWAALSSRRHSMFFFRLLIMFSLTNYLLFLPAVLVITLLPGPDFAIVVKTALLSGRRQALACAFGINCGVAVHTIAAILGISAVIAGSAELFAVLKWAGAAYLFYLGLRSLLASRRHESHEDGAPIEAAAAALQNAKAETPAAAFRSGLFCNLLNPKVVLFVLTFFPQFMDAALPAGPQLALMGVTWAFLGLAWLAVLVVMMDRIRPIFGRLAFQRWLNRTMGVILILFGLRLAAARN